MAIYQYLLSYTQQLTLKVNCRRFLYYSDAVDVKDHWENDNFIKKHQMGNHLGARMNNAFATHFSEGYQCLVIIGSDCIELTPSIIQMAFTQLQHHEVVIGPAEDGGYYLLGMSGYLPQLFNNKQWGGSGVYADTMAQIKALAISVYTLPQLNDIDEEKDLPTNWQQWPGVKYD